jgi:type IV secretion system protein VirD4
VTQAGILATAQAHLRLFDSDLVRRLTDATSLDLGALLAGRPMTLYVVVPPERIAAYAPLLRVLFTGLIQLLTRRGAPPAHRTLLLLDEAAQLGRMEAFLTAATLMRSYGLSLWSVWQSAAQLSVYGEQARTLVDNAGVVQVFGVRNRRAAAELAGLVGGVDPDALMRLGPGRQVLAIEGGEPRVAAQVRYYDDAMFAGLWDDGGLVWRRGR